MERTFHAIGLLLLFAALPAGCSPPAAPVPITSTSQRLRVLLLQDADRAELVADNPFISRDSAQARPANLPGGFGVDISLASDGWHIGRAIYGQGVLTILPSSVEGMRLNGIAYHGAFCLLPTSAGKFDVINEVDVEDYLKGVVTKEMYANWPLEAIKAQAIASRTYALFEAHSSTMPRPWDVFSDERSQMYGGISGESAQSREAVDATAGIVLTYGPGDGRIFRAYFSSCCGGVTQAAADAFPGEPYIPPLSEQYHGACCSGSKYFNWGPITIKKTELTRRLHLWATRRGKETGTVLPEMNITGIYHIDVQSTNRYGRPNRVLITDARGVQYSWPAENLRSAFNTDPRGGPTLPSSFCKINSDPNANAITFYDGHGYGHGVGMCQWCAEARAAAGQSYIQILVDAYPYAKLVRAY